MELIPDHPIIRNLERTGYPFGKEPESPTCPVCGSTYFEIYTDRDGDVFGCDECIIKKTVYDIVDSM